MSLGSNLVLAQSAGSALHAGPIAVDGHTMGPDSLLRYLRIKVHHLIQEQDWDSINIVGSYDRQAVISEYEKTDKLFNFERPTAEVHCRDLVIKAFPGTDYVHHYALIIATYLAMTGRPSDTVTYQLPEAAVCRAAVESLDLDLDGDLVVVGWGLQHLAPAGSVWTRGPGYAWQRSQVHGRRVVYLGFLHSIWGDVAGRVVARLAALGARDVVYVGKVGVLAPAIEPNTMLATGNESLVGSSVVAWEDFFGGFAADQPGVHTGVHVTSPSILLEDRDWLTKHAEHAFVDPEIGPMGAAARQAGIRFGYLHVISNNLARHYPADLSNERHRDVIRRRAVLVGQIRDTVRVEAVACPDRASAEQSGQCTRCAGQDDFRFAHQIHKGGHAPDALRRYVDQPHWLYLATFADGTTKVGTAAESRKRSRLDEQGALFATYLAKADDGRVVRHLEDALTRRLGVSQAVRAAAKLQALADLRDLSTARAAHEEGAGCAAEALAAMNTPAVLEVWAPPAEGERLRTPSGERALYQHDLREGEHGFTPLSCVGSQVLFVIDNDEGMAYLLDLGALKGRRIAVGPFSSPGTAVQSALF